MARRRPEHDPAHLVFDAKARNLRERMEVVSLLCWLFQKGKSAKEIRDELKTKYTRYASHWTREDSWRMIRTAAKEGYFVYRPPRELELAEQLATAYRWERERVTVVGSPSPDHIAQQAAERLHEMIRLKCEAGHEVVHIGFAGGAMLRKVAQELSELLRGRAQGNPKKIVFHAMVAAFDEEHFEYDPNNFITYFLPEPTGIEIGFVRMPAPGLVETDLHETLAKFGAMRRVREQVEDLDIVATGGGSWLDDHSMLRNYMGVTKEKDVDRLKRSGAVGDILWQPVSAEGPIDLADVKLAYRPTTLVELTELPGLIRKNVRVLLVLGPCSQCASPHGELLDAILGASPPLVTDVVTDISNVHDLADKVPKRAVR